MKKIILGILLLNSMCLSAQTLKYDLNNDGSEDISDVTFLVDYLLNKEKKLDYEYTDLGLSVKWATCNVGASKPEDYGLYFAWGETTGYTSDTSDGRVFDFENYSLCDGTNTTMTKYCTNSSYGTVDNLTTLESTDDAATANWGEKWRMPTDSEMKELVDNCNWTWTTQNGVNGYVVTGTNGNSIFLPAAGGRNLSFFVYAGTYGYYWTSSVGIPSSCSAYDMFFNSSGVNSYWGTRCVANSIRPVYK